MTTSEVHALLLRSLPSLYEDQTLETLPQHIVQFVSGIIDSDILAYNEVNLERGEARVVFNVADFHGSPYLRIFESFMPEHPLIQYQMRTGDMTAHKISDFLSRAEFHRTAIYHELYRHLAGEDQFAFSLQLGRQTAVSIALNRKRRNFTESDRALLNLLQPHLVQAYRNAEARSATLHELRALRDLPQAGDVGLIMLDRRGRVRHATERAQALMQQYFPDSGVARLVPPEVRAWVEASCDWLGRPLPNARTEFCVPGAAGSLKLQLIRRAESADCVLRLTEHGAPLSARPLQALALTARQAEVLLWVAQGKRNSEIAIILGTAPRTVQKHLETIFAKLGVESRTAAARRALEVLNGGPPA